MAATWKQAQHVAPASAIREMGSKTPVPGRIIISTPTKPKAMEAARRGPIGSPKSRNAKSITNYGTTAKIAPRSANGKYETAKIKALICPSIMTDRSSCRPGVADRIVRARPLLDANAKANRIKIQNLIARICGNAKVSVRCFEIASMTDSKNMANIIKAMPSRGRSARCAFSSCKFGLPHFIADKINR